MKKTEIEQYLQNVEEQLINNAPRNIINVYRSWAEQFPKGSAVYIFREGDEICYVGETGSFRGRMYDFLNTKNHSLRRNYGNYHFSKHKDFVKATSKKSFPKIIEELINDKITTTLTVSYIEIDLGRKELEERLFEKYRPKYAIKGKRGAAKVYSKEEQQKRNAQAYEPWTREQDDQLEVLYSEGTKVKKLSAIFERTEGSIRSRIKKLELKEIYGF